MKVCMLYSVGALSVSFALVSVYAYPGGQQQHRSVILSSTALPTYNLTSSTIIVDSSTKEKFNLQPTPTSSSSEMTSLSSSTVDSRTANVTTPSATSTNSPLEVRDHQYDFALSPPSSLLGVLGDEVDGEEDEGEDEDCEEEDEEEGEWLRRGDDDNCNSALSAILAQLEEIKIKLGELASPLPSKSFKRQLGDVLDQEQAYGNRGKDLTQEQKASIEALVKGVNGYQASLDGATNTGQSEQETWQETSPLLDSIPILSSITPSQLEELLALLKMMEEQKKPSSSALGSQAGQEASQASWLIPGESLVHEAHSSAASSTNSAKDTITSAPDTQSMILFARLKQLQKQEQALLVQIEGHSLAQQRRDGTRLLYKANTLHPLEPEPDSGLYNMSEEELDEVTLMILAEEEKSRHYTSSSMTTTATPSSTSPTGSPSSTVFPTNASQHRRRSYSTPKEKGSDESQARLAIQLLAIKLAASLSTPSSTVSNIPTNSFPPLVAAEAPDSKRLLSTLLDELDPALRRRLLED